MARLLLEGSGGWVQHSSNAWPAGRSADNQKLVDQLSRAERQGELGLAVRLSASLGGRAFRQGHYRAAHHWLEWSLQLLKLSGKYCCMQAWPIIQPLFMLKILLGLPVFLEQLLPGEHGTERDETVWLRQFLTIHLQLSQGEREAALQTAQQCWEQGSRRDWFMYFVNPYVRLLMAAGEHLNSQLVVQKTLTLTAGLPRMHWDHALLNAGVVMSVSQPAQAATLFNMIQPQLSVPWQLQAGLFMADALHRTGKADEARKALLALHPHLREVAPAGLAALGFPLPDQAFSMLYQEEQPKAAETSLRLRFLGRNDATLNDRLLGLRPRFAEMLVILSVHPEGLTTEQFSLALYGDQHDPACCKTELSRLKQLIPLHSRPYRLAASVQADYLELPRLLQRGELRQAIELYQGPLLPSSDAPEIRSLRGELEETLRQAILESRNGELLWLLGSRLHQDLSVWEAILETLLAGDPRRGMALAHVNGLRRSWGLA